MLGTIEMQVRRFVAAFRYRRSEFGRRVLRKAIETITSDLDMMARFRDLFSSVQFEQEFLSKATGFKNRMKMLSWTLDRAPAEGLHLEFGVYKGDSINHLAALKRNVTWHGFDSFTGLPENWALGSKAGSLSVGGRLPPVRPNVKLIKGLFQDTLPPFVAAHRGAKIALLHIDCDIYSSTKTVLAELKDMLVPGSVIVFDEFMNYPGWQEHEYRAFMEFVAEHDVFFEYLSYMRTGAQVAVRLTGAPAQASGSHAASPQLAPSP
jgi:hypothetical protein